MTRNMREAFYNDQLQRNADLIDQISKRSQVTISKKSSDMLSKITADRTTISKRSSNFV